jgi:hypothetical protein
MAAQPTPQVDTTEMASLRYPRDNGQQIYNGAYGKNGRPAVAVLGPNGLSFRNPSFSQGKYQTTYENAPTVPSNSLRQL